MRYWIFQGNPDRFDIDQYLCSSKYIYWVVSREAHQSEVDIGDHVFIWRAAGKAGKIAGIVAIGTIIEACKAKSLIDHPESLSDKLWISASAEPSEVKAGVHLEEVRVSPEKGMLTRKQLELDETLSSLHVMTVQQGTNFKIEQSEWNHLLDLWTAPNSLEGVGPQYDLSAAEGAITYRIHKCRERNPQLASQAKEQFRVKYGRLFCELCSFSFKETYGDLGEDFIEVHHKKPLASIERGEQTRPEDLMLLCSNCHSVIHRGNAEANLDALSAIFGHRT